MHFSPEYFIAKVLDGALKRNAAFLREHGSLFACVQPPPENYTMGELGSCFGNAVMAAVRDKSLTYVEGYAMGISDPGSAHHAWCIDEAGNVLELTWPWVECQKVYFGVPIQLSFVLKMIAEHNPGEFRPLLDFPKNRRPLISKYSRQKELWAAQLTWNATTKAVTKPAKASESKDKANMATKKRKRSSNR